MALILFIGTLCCVFFTAGLLLMAVLKASAYDSGYTAGWVDASKAPPFLLSQDTQGPGEDLAHLLYERTN